MKAKLSVVLLVASCAVAVLTLLASLGWMIGLRIPADVNQELHEQAGLYLIGFLYVVAPALGLLALVCTIAAGIYFARGRQSLDLWSLCLSAGSLVALVAQEVF
jgi:hypothetical protein